MANKEAKEIDLIELLLKFIIFIKRRYLIISIILITGTTIGFFKEFFEKKNYENRIIGSSEIIPNSFIFQILKSLKQDFDYQNKYFPTELNLSTEITNKITRINFDTLSFNNKNSIEIKIQSKDSISCELTKTAILIYLHKNAFVNEEYKYVVQQKKLLISEINRKIKELDSLQRLVRISSIKNNNQITIINSNYSEYIALVEKKIKTEKELQLANKIIYIYLDTTTLLSNKVLLKSVIWFLISAFVGFITAFILELRIKIKDYKKI